MTDQQPPPQTELARIAELFETLYVREPGFTGELLGLLRHRTLNELAMIFGSPVTSPNVPTPAAVAVQEIAPAVALAEASPGPPGPSWMKPSERSQLQQPYEEPRWDAAGKRLNPTPSVFPRSRELPTPVGTHWSR
jgi:hypothetical protein